MNKNIDTTKTISLYGFLRPKKGYEDELRESLLSLVRPTRAEEGSLIYNVHEEKDGSFFLYEVWRSQEDLDKHWQQPYLKDFMSKVKNLLEGKIEAYSGKLISGLSASLVGTVGQHDAQSSHAAWKLYQSCAQGHSTGKLW